MAFDRLGDIVVHHRQTGPVDAPLLVFVNSLGTDLRVWDDLLPRFADRFCCVRYDKRGHGLSDVTPGPYSMDGLAEDLAHVLDARGAKGTLVCGLSIGGMIAQALTTARPDLVRGLVLMDTAHKIGTAAMWSERIDAIRAGGIGSIADAILSRWFSASFHRDRPDELAGWRNMLTRTPLEGYLACCAAIRDADLTAAVRTVADHAQGRHRDRARGCGQIGVADGGAAGKVAIKWRSGEHVAPARELSRMGLAEQRREPALHDVVRERLDAAVFDASDPLGPEFRRPDRRRGTAKCDRLDALGIARGQTLRDQATDGQADEGETLDPEMIEKSQKIVGMLIDRIGRLRRVREAMPALVVEDDTEILGEGRHDLLPDAEIAPKGIDEDESGAVGRTDDLMMKNDAVDACECHARPQCSEPTPM